MTALWRKQSELCDEHRIMTRTFATELDISAATGSKWENNSMPTALNIQVLIAEADC